MPLLLPPKIFFEGNEGSGSGRKKRKSANLTLVKPFEKSTGYE
jgi:hypothetical protein